MFRMILGFGILLSDAAYAQQSQLNWYRPDGRDNPAQLDLDITACEGRVSQVQAMNPQAPYDYLDTIMRGCMAERGYGLR